VLIEKAFARNQETAYGECMPVKRSGILKEDPSSWTEPPDRNSIESMSSTNIGDGASLVRFLRISSGTTIAVRDTRG